MRVEMGTSFGRCPIRVYESASILLFLCIKRAHPLLQAHAWRASGLTTRCSDSFERPELVNRVSVLKRSVSRLER